MKEEKTYPTESQGILKLLMLSLRGWLRALWLALPAFILIFGLTHGVAYVSSLMPGSPKIYVVLFIELILMMGFIFWIFLLVHRSWQAGPFSWKAASMQALGRYFPALWPSLLIVIVMIVLVIVGVFLSRYLTPYMHIFGAAGSSLLVAFAGLLGFICWVVCFYWPCYLLRDGGSFNFAFKKSLFVCGTSKKVSTYLPSIATMLVVLVTHPNMPWMHFFHLAWINLLIGYVIKWACAAWVINITCLIMNELDLTIIADSKKS